MFKAHQPTHSENMANPDNLYEPMPISYRLVSIIMIIGQPIPNALADPFRKHANHDNIYGSMPISHKLASTIIIIGQHVQSTSANPFRKHSQP